MVQDQNHPVSAAYEDEIDLRELLSTIWQGKWIIAAFIFAGSAVGVAAALLATPRYRVETLVSSVQAQASGGGAGAALKSQFGGLAALAGVDLPGGGGNEAEAIAVLQSHRFIATFITDNNLMPVLFASGWDADQKKWKEADPQKQPTLNGAVKVFSKSILKVNQDKKTKLITLSIEWKNPVQAADWANQLIARCNTLLRANAIAESEKTMSYLEQEIAKTSSVEVRQAMYGLIESQVKTIAVARTQDQFAFKILDPAGVPDLRDKVYPNKPLIAILGFMAGFMIGVVFVFIKKAFATNTGKDQSQANLPKQVLGS